MLLLDIHTESGPVTHRWHQLQDGESVYSGGLSTTDVIISWRHRLSVCLERSKFKWTSSRSRTTGRSTTSWTGDGSTSRRRSSLTSIPNISSTLHSDPRRRSSKWLRHMPLLKMLNRYPLIVALYLFIFESLLEVIFCIKKAEQNSLKSNETAVVIVLAVSLVFPY